MNVSLTPELEQLIHDRVSSGRYHSASEVVREALRRVGTVDDEVGAHGPEAKRFVGEVLAHMTELRHLRSHRRTELVQDPSSGCRIGLGDVAAESRRSS